MGIATKSSVTVGIATKPSVTVGLVTKTRCYSGISDQNPVLQWGLLPNTVLQWGMLPNTVSLWHPEHGHGYPSRAIPWAHPLPRVLHHPVPTTPCTHHCTTEMPDCMTHTSRPGENREKGDKRVLNNRTVSVQSATGYMLCRTVPNTRVGGVRSLIPG